MSSTLEWIILAVVIAGAAILLVLKVIDFVRRAGSNDPGGCGCGCSDCALSHQCNLPDKKGPDHSPTPQPPANQQHTH